MTEHQTPEAKDFGFWQQNSGHLLLFPGSQKRGHSYFISVLLNPRLFKLLLSSIQTDCIIAQIEQKVFVMIEDYFP